MNDHIRPAVLHDRKHPQAIGQIELRTHDASPLMAMAQGGLEQGRTDHALSAGYQDAHPLPP